MNAISFVFINGQFAENESSLALLPKSVECRVEGGLFLQIPKHETIRLPIHLKFLNDGAKTTELQNTIITNENSHMSLIEE